MSGSRFDYVQYDEQAVSDQTTLKILFEDLEKVIEKSIPVGRAKSLVMTKLEEAYMWCGKGIRDAQIARNGSAPLQEERTTS